MTAKGKITTARLRPGDRIMVRLRGEGKATASPTKVKDAVTMRVDEVTTVPAYARGRQAGYRIDGRVPGGEVVTIGWSSGSQTYWLES